MHSKGIILFSRLTTTKRRQLIVRIIEDAIYSVFFGGAFVAFLWTMSRFLDRLGVG